MTLNHINREVHYSRFYFWWIRLNLFELMYSLSKCHNVVEMICLINPCFRFSTYTLVLPVLRTKVVFRVDTSYM